MAALGCALLVAGCGGGDEGSESSGGGGTSSGGGSASANKEPYRIGAAVDITGAFSATAAPKLEGLQLYADWINSKGGIDGHPLEIEVKDNQSNPSQAATNARSFLNSDVSLTYFASVSATLAPYLQAAKDMPTLYGNVCYPPATAPKPSPSFFCIGASVETDAKVFVDLLEEMSDVEKPKVHIVTADIPGCRYMNGTVIADALKAKGATVTGVEVVPPTITDLEAVAGKIKNAGADAVIQYCLVPQMLALGDALKREDWDGIYLITAQHETTTTGIEKAQYPPMYGLQAFSLPSEDSAVWKDIQEAYDKFSPKLALVDQRFGWANGMVLEKALRECGFPCERAKLLEVMNNLTMDDPKFVELFFGELKWTPDNHTTDIKRYQLSHWDEAEKAVVNTLPEPLERKEEGMEAQ